MPARRASSKAELMSTFLPGVTLSLLQKLPESNQNEAMPQALSGGFHTDDQKKQTQRTTKELLREKNVKEQR